MLLKCCFYSPPLLNVLTTEDTPCTHHHQTALDIIYLVDLSETTANVDIINRPHSLFRFGGGYSIMFSAFIAS